MATYKALRGVTIPTVDGDFSNIALGDIWYNSSLRKIRVGKTTAGSWAAGGNVPVNYGTNSAFGIQTAAVIFFGDSPGSPTSGTY